MENSNLSVTSVSQTHAPKKSAGFLRSTIVASAVCALGLFSASCGESSKNMKIEGITGPVLELVDDILLVSVVFDNLNLAGGIRTNIPKYPNSFLEIAPDFESAGTLVTIGISLDDVLYNQTQKLDPQALPGGRPLPGVSGGTLPAVAFTVSQLKNISFYLGPKVFGIFVPIPKLGVQGQIITSRFYTGKNRAGNLSLIGQDQNGENGGFLLLLDLSSQVKRQMRKLAARY